MITREFDTIAAISTPLGEGAIGIVRLSGTDSFTIAQKIFKKPRISHIALDKYGSFVWQQMDGKRNVYDISKLVSERFGKDAEPVVERLVKYIQILYQNKFIGYVKQK